MARRKALTLDRDGVALRPDERQVDAERSQQLVRGSTGRENDGVACVITIVGGHGPAAAYVLGVRGQRTNPR